VTRLVYILHCRLLARRSLQQLRLRGQPHHVLPSARETVASCNKLARRGACHPCRVLTRRCSWRQDWAQRYAPAVAQSAAPARAPPANATASRAALRSLYEAAGVPRPAVTPDLRRTGAGAPQPDDAAHAAPAMPPATPAGGAPAAAAVDAGGAPPAPMPAAPAAEDAAQQERWRGALNSKSGVRGRVCSRRQCRCSGCPCWPCQWSRLCCRLSLDLGTCVCVAGHAEQRLSAGIPGGADLVMQGVHERPTAAGTGGAAARRHAHSDDTARSPAAAAPRDGPQPLPAPVGAPAGARDHLAAVASKQCTSRVRAA
jgi:hypothetical protein